MKSFISCCTLFVLAIFLLTACGEEESANVTSNGDSEKELTTIPSTNSDIKVDELKEEEINQMRDSVEQLKSAASPFLTAGCCAEEDQQTETCCCEAVFTAYKSMLEAGKGDVIEIAMTDPILADCRKLMPSEFDKLENPPSEEPEDLDDLFN